MVPTFYNWPLFHAGFFKLSWRDANLHTFFTIKVNLGYEAFLYNISENRYYLNTLLSEIFPGRKFRGFVIFLPNREI